MGGVLISFDLAARHDLLAKLLAVLLLISLVVSTSLQGFILIVAIAAYYFFEDKIASFLKNYLKFLYLDPRYLSKIYAFGITFVILFTVALFGYKFNNKFYKIYRLFRGENVFNFSFDVNRNYDLHNSCPECSEFMDWAKHYKGKMFIAPYGVSYFTYIRYLTGNSLYISNMGQLSYAPRFYLLGYQRMLETGVKIKNRVVYGEEYYDTADYYKIPLERFKKLEADFVVFDKNSPNYTPKDAKPVFENQKIVVYSLR